MILVIVESPAKCKKINSFLGKNYMVKASFGHIRDLVKGLKAIDIKNNYKPTYRSLPSKSKVIKELKQASKKATEVIIASDLDREGEAIGFHVAKILKLNITTTKRIVFNQITKKAVLDALNNPKTIDMNLFNSQQARRIMDRLVGFELSPLLWKHVNKNLSAGRCQSPALRLVYDREKKIENFSSNCYFETTGDFDTANKLELNGVFKKKYNKLEDVKLLLDNCKTSIFKITKITKKIGTNRPSPPFTTSSLQQESSNKYGFSPKLTMQIAQKLYEAGKITYMRTDSVALSEEAMLKAKDFILDKFGKKYYQKRFYKNKSKSSQEAHEAIRPVYFKENELKGNFLDSQKKLYKLIHKRATACQMKDAKKNNFNIIISMSNRNDLVECKIEEIIFLGYLKIYDVCLTDKNEKLHNLKENEIVIYETVESKEKHTKATGRYTEASLVKALEKKGIGRPSTFSNLIGTIQDRKYVVKETRKGKDKEIIVLTLNNGISKIKIKKDKISMGNEKNKLFITDIGIATIEFLIKHFPKLLEYNFTSEIEKELDKIAKGELVWYSVIDLVYNGFHPKVLKLKTQNKDDNKRLLGEHNGEKVFVYLGKYGPVAQLGNKTEHKKNKFYSIPKDKSIKTITLEDMIDLMKYPKDIGLHDGKPILVKRGPFGVYLNYNNRNISLKEVDIDTLDFPKAIKIINKQKNNLIKTISKDMIITNGLYGPYIKCQKGNFSIPKKIDPETLDLKMCEEIMEAKTKRKKKTKKIKKTDKIKKIKKIKKTTKN